MRLTTIEEIKSNPGMVLDASFSLSNLYERYFENPPKDHRAAGVHASEVVQCMRQAYYSLVSTKKESAIDLDMHRRFLIGEAVHESVQRAFRYVCNMSSAPKITFQSEVSTVGTDLHRDLKVTSSCDGVFTFYDQSTTPFLRMGLEIKTESSTSWKNRSKPEEKHIDQGHVYMKALDLPMMYFMYINKESGTVTPCETPFIQVFDPERWAKIEKRIFTVLDFEALGEPPDFEKGSHCYWCAYRQTCRPFDNKTNPDLHIPEHLRSKL